MHPYLMPMLTLVMEKRVQLIICASLLHVQVPFEHTPWVALYIVGMHCGVP